MNLKLILVIPFFSFSLFASGQSVISPDTLFSKINADVASDNYESAREIYKELEALYSQNQIEPDTTFGKASLKIAQSYIFSNNIKESKIYYIRAKALLKQDSTIKPIYLLQCYLGLGVIYKRESMLDTAIMYYNEAKDLAISKYGPDDKSLHNIYNNLGNTFRILGQFEDAIDNHEQSLRIRLKHYPDSYRIGDSYNNLGLVYTDLKQFSKSNLYFIEALKYYTSDNNAIKLRAAKANYNISRIYHDLNQFEKSLSFVEPAIEIMNKINQKNDFFFAEMLTLKTNLLIELNRLDDAEILLSTIVDLKSKYLDDNHLNWNFTYMSAAYLARQKKEYSEQKKILHKTLDLIKEHYPPNHPEIAEVYFLLIENAIFRKDISEAFTNIDSIDQILTDNNGALNDQLKIKKNYYLAKLSYSKYSASNDQQHLNEALEYIKQSIKSDADLKRFGLEEKSQLLMSSNQRYLTDLAAKLNFEAYVKTGRSEFAENALVITDHSKSQLLSQVIRSGKGFVFNQVPKDVLDKEHVLKETLNNVREAFYQKSDDSILYLDQYNQALENLSEHYINLKEDFPKYYNFLLNDEGIDVDQLSNYCSKENTIFLSYYIAGRDMYIFRIDSKGVRLYKKTTPDSEHILSFRNSLTNNDNSNYREQGSQLFEQLLDGVIDANDSGKDLVIIGDQFLNTLSFDVLIPNFGDADFLIKMFAISYFYSLETWSLQNQPKKSGNRKSILAIAPDYDFESISRTDSSETMHSKIGLRNTLQRLPGAIDAAKSVVETPNSKALIGGMATKSTFLENVSDYSILHFSMHGINDLEDPLSSGLVFQSSSQEDDILTARNIFGMELQSDLAVLAACNSGWGNYDSTEGLNSLGYAFSYAGVPSNIMGLWSVPDDATSKIMKSFYSNLSDGMKKNRALQQAKIDYLNTTIDTAQINPFYWAGLVLNGNVEKIRIRQGNQPIKYAALAILLIISIFIIVRRRSRSSAQVNS